MKISNLLKERKIDQSLPNWCQNILSSHSDNDFYLSKCQHHSEGLTLTVEHEMDKSSQQWCQKNLRQRKFKLKSNNANRQILVKALSRGLDLLSSIFQMISGLSLNFKPTPDGDNFFTLCQLLELTGHYLTSSTFYATQRSPKWQKFQPKVDRTGQDAMWD